MNEGVIRADSHESEQAEIKIFFSKAKEFYENTFTQGEELYGIAFRLTDGFRTITYDSIVQDPRIVKILRFVTVPVLSQMKLGQVVGLNTTSNIEAGKTPDKNVGRRIVRVINANLDGTRFIWINRAVKPSLINTVEEYAMHWTCSLIANENSATVYRNWRKDIQENHILEAFLKAAYVEVKGVKVIRAISDILPGQFTREVKIRGGSIQKADFVIRLKKTRRLLALEAKAIGVAIDAYKRMKEVRDKKRDWEHVFGDRVIIGAVVAGFVPFEEVKVLIESGVVVFWEHDLKRLSRFVSSA